ncbi:Cyclic pyranopterin monophosphate synthase [Pseudodesulfovibrio hydrargyri]|uniref:Cyclic pyranopterin monophosphate synthase n=1 Tax=Pseudodesulfovibrio hydrargyri TaxID=2125990 RepID=A0A1J5MRF4_9BACT|nr:radical SAM protein [Pseudodesulfovibrio hydrargyri]OIQ49174.1 Cyclic pyranopterin monophosphate synthase [Pseudodesulfovibrio hydrargyri]
MKVIDQNYSILGKVQRHLKPSLKSLTVKKSINALKCLADFSLKREQVRGLPFMLKIESASMCNLKCKGCRTGAHPEIGTGVLTADEFVEIVEPIKEYLLEAAIYIWGEPLMNRKHLPAMVRHLTENNISSMISTNCHFLDEAMSKQLIDAGLTKLILAVDGMSQESYGQIRLGGNFEIVKSNIINFARIKREKKSRWPLIEWQYVKTDFNKRELPQAMALAEELGVDFFTVLPDWCRRDTDEKVVKSRARLKKIRKRACYWLWSSIAVQWDGTVYPCCHTANNGRNSFGKMPINEIWNSAIYKESRAIFNNTGDGAEKKGKSVCFRCPM